MFLIYHTKEKEVRKKKRRHTKKDILLLKIDDGLSREQTLGTTDSESCLQDMKRR
jgi:hypothetical protein